jgi:hypothetical protein
VTEAVASLLPNEPAIVFDLVSLKKCEQLFFECGGAMVFLLKMM